MLLFSHRSHVAHVCLFCGTLGAVVDVAVGPVRQSLSFRGVRLTFRLAAQVSPQWRYQTSLTSGSKSTGHKGHLGAPLTGLVRQLEGGPFVGRPEGLHEKLGTEDLR